MRDDLKQVIYVGKANNLRKRVMSYFVGKKDLKVEILRQRVRRISVILCQNQYEALVLENNLIKHHRPRYNIQLKDDKSYPLLRITNEDFPRVFPTRKRIEDGSFYYGPFPDSKRLQHYLKLIQRLFKFRRCTGSLPKRTQPCLYYHTGDCEAPCVGKVDRASYQHQVQRLKSLLAGRSSMIERDLQRQMLLASEKMEFEQAANLRDMLDAVRQLLIEQPMQDFSSEKKDYLAISRQQQWYFFALLLMRGGQVLTNECYHCEYPGEEDEAISEFLLSYYDARGNNLPDKLYLESNGDYQLVEQFLTKANSSMIKIRSAPAAKRHQVLLNRALENAHREQQLWLQRHGNQHGLAALRKVLGLSQWPQIIEGFDISHSDGHDTVAAVVRFVDGRPNNSSYRYLRIKTLAARKIDDYQSIREAVLRRYQRLQSENKRLPDLILIDGGLGQVNAANEALESLQLKLPLLGLAKREECLYRPNNNIPIILPLGHFGLRLLQQVRDEAHRFANNFTQRSRQKILKLRSLESVPGIGPQRSVKLLSTYGSLAGIARCPNEELAKTMGMGSKLVALLKQYLEIWLEEGK